MTIFTKNYRKLKLRNSTFWFFLVTSIFTSFARAETNLQETHADTPKYVPGVESIAHAHQYIQKNEALLYWQISPYYLPQLTDSSCSLASATMIVNAARNSEKLTVNQPLATQSDLLQRVNDADWIKGVREGGDGVTLDQFRIFMAKALEAYGVHNFTIEVVHLKNDSKKNEDILRQTLLENEKTGKTFMIANFNQKFFTGGMSVGHFSPVGAYDQQKKLVLIMDTDRQLYEPYWVPEKLFLKSMASIDSDANNHRGYLLVKL
jgi:hypothetical protein